MYPNWQQMGAAQQMQFYGTPNAYQQQMYQWYYQQQNPNQVAVQPPVPTSMPPLPEAAPPPPSEEKPPLPPEPPPAPPSEEDKQELKPVTSEEQQKLTDLQQQAAEWQQTQQWPQQWPQQPPPPQPQPQPQWPAAEYQQYQQPPQPHAQVLAGGDVKAQFDAIQREEAEFDQQYSQWKQQYDDWKTQNQNHPNKEQFKQYELQWQQYEQQMEDKKRDIYQRKHAIQSQMAMPQQPAPSQQPAMPGIPQHQPQMMPSQHTMPPNQQGVPPNQQDMPPSQQLMPPSQQGMQPSHQGIPPNQQGMPPNQQGMPPNHQGMPLNQQVGMQQNQQSMPQHQGMPPKGQGMPVTSQGVMPNNQGMPPANQGMMHQNQGMRMGGLLGVRQNNPQRMEGPGGFNNQRMGIPHNESMQMQNQQRMGGPRGQIRMPGSDAEQIRGIEQHQPGFGGPRQRFPGGPRFSQQNQMHRMQGPRGQMVRGPRPLGSGNQFTRQGNFGQGKDQGDAFGNEGGEEDMCLEDESENKAEFIPQENPFRRPDIQKMMAEQEEEEEDVENIEEENLLMRGRNQMHRMQNMRIRGNAPNQQFKGQVQNMQMRGNFQNMGNPRGMSGPRGQMFNQRDMTQIGNVPQKMPQSGPISLMDIRFDKPPPKFGMKNEAEEKEDLLEENTKKKQESQEQSDQSDMGQNKKDDDKIEPVPKEFELGQSEKTAISGLGAGKGCIPGFGDVSDQNEDQNDSDKKGKEELSNENVEDEQKDKEKQSESDEISQESQIPHLSKQMNQGPRPQGPGQGFNQFGPRNFGPNQGQGPRQFGPNQGQGQRQFGPNQGQGPRQFGPNQGQGPRQFNPNQGQGPRQFGPNQGQGPRQFGLNQQKKSEFSQNQGPVQMQTQGQRQFGPRGFGQRGAQRGEGLRQFGPRGFGQNQGPRGFNAQAPRNVGPNQGMFKPFEEENVEQFDEQNFLQANEPLEFSNRFNQNKSDRGMWGRGRGQMNRGRGRGRGWQNNQIQEEHQIQQKEPEEAQYNEEEEKERARREMEEEGEQWMAAWHQNEDQFEDRRDPWKDRRTPPLPHDDRYGRHPYDDPYRRDPYYNREDPYYDRRDPYYPERRPYDYDPYRSHDYWYPDRYEPPPREPSPRVYMAPEVIDHGHKSSGLSDFAHDRGEPIEYKAPQVIDYGHGKSSDDSSGFSDNRGDYSRDTKQGYRRESDYYGRDNRSSSRDYGRENNRKPDHSSSRDRDRSSKSVHEPKVETVKIDDLLLPPGRKHRPPQIVVILRGLPGSGKTYIGKLIKDKEVQHGGGAPRMLCLDDYFMVEVEKTEKDPESGKKVKKKVLEYEHEPEMESTYRKNMYKSFKKTIDDGFFPFIIVDAVNEKESHFEEFWSYAKSKGFQVYIAEIQADAAACAKRNTHNRSQKEIEKIEKGWQETPKHYLHLDVRTILQEVSIQEVEMETEEEEKPAAAPEKRKKEDSDEDEDVKFGEYKKSKWEIEPSETQLDKLDGLIHHNKKIAPVHQSMEDFLQLPDDYDSRPLAPGQKRVRWADIEERKVQSRRRDIGFVVGQTQRDWERITDDSFADRQLNRTKYF